MSTSPPWPEARPSNLLFHPTFLDEATQSSLGERIRAGVYLNNTIRGVVEEVLKEEFINPRVYENEDLVTRITQRLQENVSLPVDRVVYLSRPV